MPCGQGHLAQSFKMRRTLAHRQTILMQKGPRRHARTNRNMIFCRESADIVSRTMHVILRVALRQAEYCTHFFYPLRPVIICIIFSGIGVEAQFKSIRFSDKLKRYYCIADAGFVTNAIGLNLKMVDTDSPGDKIRILPSGTLAETLVVTVRRRMRAMTGGPPSHRPVRHRMGPKADQRRQVDEDRWPGDEERWPDEI